MINNTNNLVSVFRAMGLNQLGNIPLDFPKDRFVKGIDEYYSLMEELINSEDSSNIYRDTPSKIMRDNFFKCNQLEQSLLILSKNINYVATGSWVKYKDCLIEALNNEDAELTIDDKIEKYKIIFDKKLSIEFKKGSDYRERFDYEPEIWDVKVIYSKNKVLSGIIDEGRVDEKVLLFLFKPDLWIFDVRRTAENYDARLRCMEAEESIKSKRKEFLRDS